MKRSVVLAIVVIGALVFLCAGCNSKTDPGQSQAPSRVVKTAVKTETPPAMPVAQKPAVLPEIIEKCKAFVPPWGDMEWREWGKTHPEESHLWMADVTEVMKKADLSVIPQCTHLTNMFIGYTDMKDLTPLAGLTGLQRLDMRFAENITDLTPLKGLKNLEYLNIWATGVIDLSPVSELPKLKEINARMTKISDLSPVAHMPALVTIDMLKAPVSNVQPLADNPNIKEILVCTTKVGDLTPLLPVADRVTALDLCDTPFRDFKLLPKFKNLIWLRLWGLPVKALSILSDMQNLEEVDIVKTEVTSLKPLQKLKKLKTVYMFWTDVPQKEVEALQKAVPGVNCITKMEL